jgi:hypothetical protein
MSLPYVDSDSIAQTAVYMVGMLSGYALLTPTEDLAKAWKTVRDVLDRRKD